MSRTTQRSLQRPIMNGCPSPTIPQWRNVTNGHWFFSTDWTASSHSNTRTQTQKKGRQFFYIWYEHRSGWAYPDFWSINPKGTQRFTLISIQSSCKGEFYARHKRWPISDALPLEAACLVSSRLLSRAPEAHNASITASAALASTYNF